MLLATKPKIVRMLLADDSHPNVKCLKWLVLDDLPLNVPKLCMYTLYLNQTTAACEGGVKGSAKVPGGWKGVQLNFYKCIYLAQLRPDSHRFTSEGSVAEVNTPPGNATYTVLASRRAAILCRTSCTRSTYHSVRRNVMRLVSLHMQPLRFQIFPWHCDSHTQSRPLWMGTPRKEKRRRVIFK